MSDVPLSSLQDMAKRWADTDIERYRNELLVRELIAVVTAYRKQHECRAQCYLCAYADTLIERAK